MTYNNYPKGSEWSKWDLHIHTPASYHWNSGKCFSEMSDMEKTDSLKVMYNTIEQSDISVFCIMDYWTFDGYLLFKKYIEDNSLSPIKTVFPGMELRIEAPVDYRLNIHVILSDRNSMQELIDFKSKLTIRSINRQISDEAIISFAQTLDISKAKKHGFGDPSTLNDFDLLKLGSMTIEVTKSSLQNAMHTLKKGSGYIIMPYDTSDGLKDLDWKTQPHADNYFMQSSHIFETRDEETIDLFTGIKTNKNRSFFDNFFKTIGDKPKPVVCGSDAHRFSKYGNYPSGKTTWIKANPTFDGFKQILYEPIDRVKIQSHNPDNITPYQIIDKVRFIDQTSNNIFPEDWIHLNPHLNVIIGGKSSGKSILMYHIAKAISPDLVLQRYSDIELTEYNFGDTALLDFEVKWMDEYKNSLSEDEDRKTRDITYLPQMYINYLAEKKGENNLKNLIESILKQNDRYLSFINVIDDEIQQFEDEVINSVNILLTLREKVKSLISIKKEIGDESSIKIELKRIDNLIDKLRKESGFTQIENKRYETLIKKYNYDERKVTTYTDLKLKYQSFELTLEGISKKTQSLIMTSLEEFPNSKLSKKHLSAIINNLNKEISDIYGKTILQIKEQILQISKKIDKHNEQLKKTKIELNPYIEKIKNRKYLTELNQKLSLQKQKLENLKKVNYNLKSITEKGRKIRDNLLEFYTNLFKSYSKIENELKKQEFNKIDDELRLKSSLSFDINKFSNSFSNLFDRRGNFGQVFGKFFNSKNEYVFKSSEHIGNIFVVFKKLSNLKKLDLRYKHGITATDALQKLFENCFEIKYTIEFKGDDILKMSPGKKGLVLLQLILHISNATHPILIDQPEDNLDNRTIYNELKSFLKKRKLLRQVILVTHNANLVVSTDSENVIVCNQSGEQINMDNLKYKFEYVTGALEYTFCKKSAKGILYQYGIREHVCDTLEGGEEAFKQRELKYGFTYL